MKKSIILAFAATTALASAAQAEDFNWGGFYGGVSAGVSGSSADAKVDLENGAKTDRGWSSNDMFSSGGVVGEFYDTTRTVTWQQEQWQYNGAPLSSASGSLRGYETPVPGTASFAPSSPWASSLDDDALGALGALRFGANFQFDALLLGAEVDGALLQSDFSSSYDISESASLNTSRTEFIDNYTDGPTTTSNQFGQTWSAECNGGTPGANGIACSYNNTYSATYSQSGGFDYNSSLDGLYTMRARAGYAAGRTLFFATGGLAVGSISMSTSANVSETAGSNWNGTARSGSTSTPTADNGSATASANTTWSNSESETAYGYAVGGGISFGVTENIILTTDGYYYDLGEHSITATSSSGNASYTVSQRFDGYVVRTGLEWKF